MLVVVSSKRYMFLFTQCSCDDCSFVSHTQLYHTLSVEKIATSPQLGVRSFESRHLRRWAEMKAPLRGLPLSWSKGPGCCSLCCYRATVLLFLVVSLGGRGSKLVTVSFRLQSRAFSSCWGGGSLLWGRKSPHLPRASLLMVYRL